MAKLELEEIELLLQTIYDRHYPKKCVNFQSWSSLVYNLVSCQSQNPVKPATA